MIRVLLVDDQALVRSGFRIILESEPDIEVVGEAANGAEAVRLAAELSPDVVCMDVEMPVMNGIDASRAIMGAGGAGPRVDTSILILTTFGHESYLFDALAAGVSGFLLKTSRAEQLIEAVRTLASGGALLGPDVTRAVMERAAQLPNTAPARAPSAVAAAVGEHSGASAATSTPTPTPTSSPHVTSEADSSDADSGFADTDSGFAEAMDAAGLTEREREVLALVVEGQSNAEIAANLFVGEATVKTHVSNLLQKLHARDRIQLVVWAYTQRSA